MPFSLDLFSNDLFNNLAGFAVVSTTLLDRTPCHNLVGLYTYTWDAGTICLVPEFAPHGDMWNYCWDNDLIEDFVKMGYA